MNSLVCPHCSRPLAEHKRPCSGITRRHLFFGLFAGLTASAIQARAVSGSAFPPDRFHEIHINAITSEEVRVWFKRNASAFDEAYNAQLRRLNVHTLPRLRR
jgi:hypothetical protein